MSMRRTVIALFTLSVACKGAEGALSARADVDSDPLALLPASAVTVGSLDARAMYGAAIGSSLDTLTDAFIPFPQTAGFVPSRDVDHVVVGTYGPTGTEVAVVVTGHFDLAKIAATTRAKNGTAIVPGNYVGFPTYTTGAVVAAPLTARTLVTGTADGVRRVLERVHDGKLGRAMAPWIVDVLQTPGANLAVAADFSAQPVASVTLGSISVPWLKGLRLARLVGDFHPPGLNVAATLTYGDADQAQSAAQGVRLVDGWLKLLAPLVGGVTLQNLDVKAQQSDLTCKFAVSDQTVRTLVSLAPRLLPPPTQ